jgi:ketosteroid isomerase-like protein
MQEHPNAAIARELGDAMTSGDMEAMDRLIADDIVWHEIGRSEPRRGKVELRDSAAGADYEITGETHDILASDDHVVALVNAKGTRGDRTLEYRTAEIYHIRDGKVTERWAFSDDTAAITEFFA